MADRPTAATRRCRIGGDDSGLSLVELLVAVTLLTVAVLMLASVSIASLSSLRDSRLRQEGSDAVSRAIELARSHSYGELAMDAGDPLLTSDPRISAGAFDPDGDDGCLPAEELVTSADGPIIGDPYQRDPSGPTGLTVRTYITDVGEVRCGTAYPEDVRRVTAVASWTGPEGDAGELRKHTLIVPAERGVPEPEFDVIPRSSSESGAPGENCLTHTLVNLGVEDSYTFHPPAPPAVQPTVYAGSPREEVSGAYGPVDTGASVPLEFCYDTLADLEQSLEVRSGFDPNVSVTLDHSIDVEPLLTLYLHHAPDNEEDHERELGPAYDFALGTSEPNQPWYPGSPGVLFNYDTNYDAYSGLGLYRDSDPTSQWDGYWRYQFEQPSGTTLSGSPKLTVWLAWDEALDGGTASQAEMTLRVRLWRLPASGDVPGDLLVDEEFVGGTDIPFHGGTGWEQRTLVLPSLSSTTFAPNEYLRLQVGCRPLTSEEQEDLGTLLLGVESPNPCMVAYDAPGQYPARLEIGLEE